jgi:hypothetical protein
MYKYLTTSLFLLVSLLTFAQTGTVKGRVYNQKNNEPLEFATIRIQGTTNGTTTDLEGNYEIVYRPGFYRLEVSYVGYETTLSAEVHIQGNQTAFIDIAVPESSTLIDEVVVRPTFNLKKIESPVSFLTIGVSDIEKAAGVNRDVSKALQSLPGVGATDPNRNDLIVRGGGPSENVFYLDGIEIPIINHFATQGSSGGVVGIINPDFVREVNFYTGAFPANRPNALSSVMDIRQKDGSRDRIHTQLGIGASDAAFTMDGPIGDKTTFIVSARQSYLQLLFKFIGLPFLPTYNDFQVKYKYQIDPKNELSIIGLGAIDNMTLNTDLQIEEANIILKAKGLHAEIVDSVYNRDAVPGAILDQTPKADNKVKEGRSIYVTVYSKNPQQIAVPGLVDYSTRQAVALLNSLGFTQISIQEVPSEYSGLVMAVEYRGRALLPDEKIPAGSPLNLVVSSSTLADSLGVNDEIIIAPGISDIDTGNQSSGEGIFDDSFF